MAGCALCEGGLQQCTACKGTLVLQPSLSGIGIPQCLAACLPGFFPLQGQCTGEQPFDVPSLLTRYAMIVSVFLQTLVSVQVYTWSQCSVYPRLDVAAVPTIVIGSQPATCAGIGVGVGVGGLLMVVGLVFLLRGFRRVRQRHALEHGALTEQLLATEQQRMELEMEGGSVCIS